MKQWQWVPALLMVVMAPAKADDFWQSAGHSCLYGAAIWGVSSALVLYPMMRSGILAPSLTFRTTLPATPMVIGSAFFGCGVGVAVSMVTQGVDTLSKKMAAEDSGFSGFSEVLTTVSLPVPSP
ncbi:MAG: hypothetical protein WCP34_15645 [Pseudomonadota bacterium]